MEDKETKETQKYFFAIEVRQGGLLESFEDLEKTRALFEEDLEIMYGSAVRIAEFREATNEEAEQIPVVLEMIDPDEDDQEKPTLLN